MERINTRQLCTECRSNPKVVNDNKKLKQQLQILKQYYRESQEVVGFYGDEDNYIELCVEGRTGNPRVMEGGFVDCVVDHSDRGYAKAREFQNSELNKKAKEVCK